MKATDVLLTDQVAVITGGGGGIGRAIALALASVGADIVIGDIVPERCEETVARVQEMGRRALGIPTDVMDKAQVRSLIEKADTHFGRIDILVNNAGGVRARPFLEQSDQTWQRYLDLNFVSMLTATSAAAPIMIRGGRGGSIVNVTSIEGSRAAPNYAVVAACKAGMNSFTRTMALELSDQKIRVNAIAPDITVTPGLGGNITGPVDQSKWVARSPEWDDAQRRRVPIGHLGVDDECGDVVVFLCSQMSRYVTGAIIPVDGGTWASGGWFRNRAGEWVLCE